MSIKTSLLKIVYFKNRDYKRMCINNINNFINESHILISKYSEYTTKQDILKINMNNINNHLEILRNVFSKNSITAVFILYIKEKEVFKSVIDSCIELETCKQKLISEYPNKVSELNQWITLYLKECIDLINKINDTCQLTIWGTFNYTKFQITVDEYKEESLQYSQMISNLMNVSDYVNANIVAEKNILILTKCKDYMNQVYQTKTNIETYKENYRKNMFDMDCEFINVKQMMSKQDDQLELNKITSVNSSLKDTILPEYKLKYSNAQSERDVLRKMSDDFNKPDWYNLNRISNDAVQKLKDLKKILSK